MTRPTQAHVNTPRCQHELDGRQCQLDQGHDHTYGTACVVTTIGKTDTITRWHPAHPHLAETLDMPARRPTPPADPADPRACQGCGTTVDSRQHRYCSEKCRREARRMQSFRQRQKRSEKAAQQRQDAA